jgi:hypothetical protein
MPKSRKRKKTANRAARSVAVQENTTYARPAGMALRRSRSNSGASLQKVAFAAMLALGFLGMTIFFTFFYTEDPEHYIYGGIAGVTALGWLALLAHRWSQYRQHA